jgi:hypothetical protein
MWSSLRGFEIVHRSAQDKEDEVFRGADRLHIEEGGGWHADWRSGLQGRHQRRDVYTWRRKYAGLLPAEMKRLVADLSLDKALLQDVASRKL